MRTELMAWCPGLALAPAGRGDALAQIWTEYRLPGGRYTVLMPGKPEAGTRSVRE